MHIDVDAPAGSLVVFGSANIDTVLRVETLPAPGDTVLAVESSFGPGGKGANQAVAAGRVGAEVTFIAATGRDAGRDQILAELTTAGVDATHVRATSSPTGSAYVMVDAAGQNQIVVDPGANADLHGITAADHEVIARARGVLCQLEVPVDAVTECLSRGRSAGATTILNAAPALQLPQPLIDAVDVLIVNATEARTLAATQADDDAIAVLASRVPTVVVTRGADGVLLATDGGVITEVPAVPATEVIDTTGAGDAFCGAFAAAMVAGRSAIEAVQEAVVAASLSVARPGAARSAPTRAQVTARVAELRTGGGSR